MYGLHQKLMITFVSYGHTNKGFIFNFRWLPIGCSYVVIK